MYCGAPIEDETSHGNEGTTGAKTISEQTGKPGVTLEISQEERVFSRLGDLPLPLQAKVAEMMKHGEESAVDEKVYETEGFSGFESSLEAPKEEDLPFTAQKTRRSRRLHPLVLFLLFLVSAGVVAFVLWSMM
jgi:hypothetical protein